jgi:hypothetical protein
MVIIFSLQWISWSLKTLAGLSSVRRRFFKKTPALHLALDATIVAAMPGLAVVACEAKR